MNDAWRFDANAIADSPHAREVMAKAEREGERERERERARARAAEEYAKECRAMAHGERTYTRECLTGASAEERAFAQAMERLASERERLAAWALGTLAQDVRERSERNGERVREGRRKMEVRRREYEGSRAKQLSAKTSSERDRADEDVHATREAFERARLEAMLALQRAEVGKRANGRKSAKEFMEAQLDYHRRAVELLTPLRASFGRVDAFVADVEKENVHIEVSLAEAMSKLIASSASTQSTIDALSMVSDRSRELSAQMASSAAAPGSGGALDALMQGWLYKRSSSALGDWKRRFFVLDVKGNLTYVKSQSSKSLLVPTMLFGFGKKSEGDVSQTVSLLTATIKPDLDDTEVRFAFRVVSPERTYFLRAENQGERQMWIEAITTVIANLLSSSVNHQIMSEHDDKVRRNNRNSYSVRSSPTALEGPSPLSVLSLIRGNGECADCGMPEPDWASLNLGIMLCIQCSGVHRQLGVQVSKVRSATLDVRAWEPGVIEFFKRWGNEESNKRWEAEEGASEAKPAASATVDVKKAYILEKYVARRYCRRRSAPSESALLAAIQANSLTAVMDVLLAGCHVKMEYAALVAACECGDASLAIIEALLQHNVNVNAVDDRSKDTALHYAVAKGHDASAKTLLHRGADATKKNFKGATPLDVAIARGGIRDDDLLIMLTCT